MNKLTDILRELGFSLDEKQPHMSGERRIFAAGKFVLFGTRNSDSARVVIKASNSARITAEIEKEHLSRKALDEIRFAYGTFLSPEEILFLQQDGYTILVTRFIEQDMAFSERPIKEQFSLALSGLKAMESAHAATYEHERSVRGIFATMAPKDYLEKSSGRTRNILEEHLEDIERYCGFLTHFDFMPQNIRVAGGQIYLLDHSSLRFSNKHESWARLINFMVLHNGELARALLKYVTDNRAPEENVSLQMMCIFRLNELIAHHARIAEATEENLHELSRKRVLFWEYVLDCALNGAPVSEDVVSEFKAARDTLRSPEEKERQKGLH